LLYNRTNAVWTDILITMLNYFIYKKAVLYSKDDRAMRAI